MASYKKTEETNWKRASQLLTEAGKDLLTQFLHQSVSVTTHPSLDAFLASHRKTIQHLVDRQILFDTQMDVLYPDSGYTDTDQWDITLLSCVLNKCVPNKTPSQKLYVRKIQELRNRLAHDGARKMNGDEFAQIWKEIQDVLKKAAQEMLGNKDSFDLESKINKCLNDEIVDGEKLRNILQAWKASDLALLETIEEVKQSQTEIINMLAAKGTEIPELKDRVQSIEDMSSQITAGCSHSPLQGQRRRVSQDWADILPFPKRTMSCFTSETTSTVHEQLSNDLRHKLRCVQSELLEYYKTCIVKSPTGVQETSRHTDIADIYAEPEMILIDHTALTKENAEGKKIAFEEVFEGQNRKYRKIYVSGDAGMGKTTLCKHLVSLWCNAHSQGFESRNAEDKVSIMEQFYFLFYISLRHAVGKYEIEEMIVSQLLEVSGDSIRHILQHYSERCLVILDGLDEWVAPKASTYPSVSNGIPGRNPHLKYTLLTTSRPWKLELLRLKDLEIDQQVQLNGVKSLLDFGERLVLHYNQRSNTQKYFSDFLNLLEAKHLERLVDTPILLKQLICLWYNDKPIGSSRTEVYTNMMELLFELAEQRKGVSDFNVKKNIRLQELVGTKTCFKKGGTCVRYIPLLLLIGRLAYETLFGGETETQLVFDSLEAERYGISAEDIDICLKVGILTQSILPDMACRRKSISFLHKTFQEYCAALYLSVYAVCTPDLESTLGPKLNSVDNVFDMEDLLMFLCGMCPSLMRNISDSLVEDIDKNKEVMAERKTITHSEYTTCQRMQAMVLSCCKETSDNEKGPLYIPVPDVTLPCVKGNQRITLGHCLRQHPKSLKSFTWRLTGRARDNTDNTLNGILSVAGNKYRLDLTNSCNLKKLSLGSPEPCIVTWKLNEHQLVVLQLVGISCKFVPAIKCASNLRALSLESLLYKEAQVGYESSFDIDLSGHKELTFLYLANVSPRSLKVGPLVEDVVIRNIDSLTQDGMESLMASLSNSCSLKSVNLQSVKCSHIPGGTEHEYAIDLSNHSGLKILNMEDILLGCVLFSKYVREIKLKNICIQTHDGMRFLMSCIADASLVETIHVESVQCIEHSSRTECAYTIDLSTHALLKKVDLENVFPENVTISSSVNDLNLMDIRSLTQNGIRSLWSSISGGRSLQQLQLQSVKCKQEGSGGDGFKIDLSGHTELKILHLRDVSLDSLVVTTSVTEFVLRDVHFLTHDGVHTLMTGISKAHSSDKIHLRSLTCGRHASWRECGYEMDLSEHDRLMDLYLEDLSITSVSLNPAIKWIRMANILSLTHDGLKSLVHGASSARCLGRIRLESVQCRDHAADKYGCGYVIDLSKQAGLSKVMLSDISPRSVTVNPSVCEIWLMNIHTLNHEGISSILADARSAGWIHLKSVKCGNHSNGVECEVGVDLSRYRELNDLHLEDVSVRSVKMHPCLSKITLKNIPTLNHVALNNLMSSISNLNELEVIHLESLQCRDHVSGGYCGYALDFLRHDYLRKLHLENISPGSIKVNPFVNSLTLKNIQTFTHESMHSLMSSISCSEGYESIHLESVRCGEHADGVECRFQLDVSEQFVSKLHLENVTPGSLMLHRNIWSITIKNIRTLSHGQICSLMSVISNSDKVGRIHLESIHCRDIFSGEEIGYWIDLSKHKDLLFLDLGDISPARVTFNPSFGIREITLRNVHTLTHDALNELMRLLSNACKLERIILKSVRCREHTSGVVCGQELDLSGHIGLLELHLESLSITSVSVNDQCTLRRFSLVNVQDLSHAKLRALVSITRHCEHVNIV